MIVFYFTYKRIVRDVFISLGYDDIIGISYNTLFGKYKRLSKILYQKFHWSIIARPRKLNEYDKAAIESLNKQKQHIKYFPTDRFTLIYFGIMYTVLKEQEPTYNDIYTIAYCLKRIRNFRHIGLMVDYSITANFFEGAYDIIGCSPKSASRFVKMFLECEDRFLRHDINYYSNSLSKASIELFKTIDEKISPYPAAQFFPAEDS